MSDEPCLDDIPWGPAEPTPASELINIHPNTPPVKGYRNLTQAEVDLINEIKTKGNELGELLDRVRAAGADHWANAAEDKLRIGIMLLVRSVAKPTGF